MTLAWALLVLLAAILFWQSWGEWEVASLGENLMFVLLALSCLVLVRLIPRVRGQRDWNWKELLLAIPLLQLLSGSVTSGLSLLEIYPAIAFFLLVAPFVFPAFFRKPGLRLAFFVLCAIIVVSNMIAKTVTPYHWSDFKDAALFENRVWYRHPQYGQIYIERDKLQLMQHICAAVQADQSQQLLEITNPYANWFCNVPPWHGYVQTWYDTTSSATIDRLDADLLSAPPEWIVYQRSENIMRGNEIAFGNGKLLPHRRLDAILVGKVESGQWTLVSQQMFDGADWMVIQTRPGTPATVFKSEFVLPYPGSLAALWFRTELHRLLKK